MGILFNLAVIAYLMFVIYAANMVQRDAWQENIIRYLLYGVIFIIFLMAFFASQAIFLETLEVEMQEVATEIPEIDPVSAILTSVFAFLMGVLSIRVLNTPETRKGLKATIFVHTGYDPDSVVHTTAILLCTMLITALIVLFMLEGGTTGVAQSIDTTIPIIEPIFLMLIWLFASFLGVGYAIRRYLPDTLDRLGLAMPTSRDFIAGIGTGLGLWIVSIIFGIIWQALTTPETFEQQNLAAEQLSQAINSLPLVILISVSAAVGEEVFIRGALQPVFGIWLTSIFFALLHAQYLFAPSMFFIFGVSLVLGLLRERMNTTTAIIAHFVYNFVPLVLALSFM